MANRILDWVAAVILTALLACASASPIPADEQGALCSTDLECMALCPADEPECDGGPAPVECDTFDCWE